MSIYGVLDSPPQGEAKNTQQSETLSMGAQFWRGDHKGISIEIAVAPMGGSEAMRMEGYWSWCHYIILAEKQIPQRLYFDTFCTPDPRWREPREGGFESPSMWYHRSAPAWIEDLPWSGGCTFYQVSGGLHGQPMWVKAGCDYAHLWDSERGYPYNLAWIESDCRSVVDALLEANPDIKPRSWKS